jgi:hypothetical protein
MTGFARIDPQYDRFLYAPVCECDDMSLSVLSVLTRQDIDPWQLAAKLSQMSKAEAVNALASMVDDSDGKSFSPSTALEIAVRLIELLPSQHNFGIAPPSMQSFQGHFVIWILSGVVWGTLVFYAGNPQQTGKKDNGSPAVSAIVSQQVDAALQRPNTDQDNKVDRLRQR